MFPVTLGELHFPNVLLNASGTFNADTFSQMYPLNTALGGIVSKTVTADPKPGNAPYRTVELPGIGMLNSIGLQNPGLGYFLETEAAQLAAHGLPVIVSMSGQSMAQFAEMAERVQGHPQVAAIELNLSCPNVEAGGHHFGSDPEMVRGALNAVTTHCDKPVFAKLTPNVTDIVAIARGAVDGGAFGLTAINTVVGARIDIKTRKPVLPRVFGGYSGPGIRPVAVHAIWTLHQAFPSVPIVGVGGIETAEDVLEFLLAGASVVQVGTACFRHPFVFPRLVAQLQAYCTEHGLRSVTELTGAAHR
jgi:dihydroorotate dehydrogenase (NAD+) catalytic subunit